MMATLPPGQIDRRKELEGVDEVRNATAFLRTLKFRNSPDGKQLLEYLLNAQIKFAEAGVLDSTGKLKAHRKGGIER